MRSVLAVKTAVLSGVFLLAGLMQSFAQEAANPALNDPETAKAQLLKFAASLHAEKIEALPMRDRGRIKPLHTLAREANLFLTGRHSKWGLKPLQLYLALPLSPSAVQVEVINIRSKKLRQDLGFAKSKTLYSYTQLEQSPLLNMSQPLLEKQEKNEKSLTPYDKEVLEGFNQLLLARQIMSGEHFLGMLVGADNEGSALVASANQYLASMATGDTATADLAARQLLTAAKAQPFPEMLKSQLKTLQLEVLYNKVRLIFFAALGYLLLGLFLVLSIGKQWLKRRRILALLALPLVLHILGFAARVAITGFAPVTNMYGTMLWVSLGVTLFGSVLFLLYRNYVVLGSLLCASAGVLLLTESIPLILSPDMDPIVAVLRSNFWLSTHVLTITISYAAFTITMILGNIALVRELLGKNNAEFYRSYAHLAYRMIQLGVFLITAGIILGGIWADYSWGRFWGWDPKETWALIADLGYLAILHARFIGWLTPFGLLAAAPLAYLLVVMAWYGVNFILASGLHSYGFSSGGATMVAIFVVLQLLLVGAALLRHRRITA